MTSRALRAVGVLLATTYSRAVCPGRADVGWTTGVASEYFVRLVAYVANARLRVLIVSTDTAPESVATWLRSLWLR